MKTVLPILIILFLCGCINNTQEKDTISLNFGIGAQPTAALIYIAQDQGYFQEEGLDINFKTYPSGKRALLEGLFTGEAEIINTADVSVVFQSFERQDFKILASIGSADSIHSIIARKDMDIFEAKDIAGKRVATQKGSAVHFFLHSFLETHDLSKEDIIPSYMKAEELPKALHEGRIDAFSMREPYIGQAKDLLKEKALVFSDKGVYITSELLIAKGDYIQENPEAVKRVLKALLKAQDFAREKLNKRRLRDIHWKKCVRKHFDLPKRNYVFSQI
jgi:ABC-type nitrate/sulfonate/bicarbonate transport system substrate-binding protein